MAKKEPTVKRHRNKLKIPKALAAVADLLYITKNERLSEQKRVAEIGDDEKELKEYLINNLSKNDASGVAGKVARVTIIKEPIPRIDDEAKLMAAIKRNPKKWGALLARPSVDMAVLRQMHEEGGIPPGVSTFNIIKVSLNKV